MQNPTNVTDSRPPKHLFSSCGDRNIPDNNQDDLFLLTTLQSLKSIGTDVVQNSVLYDESLMLDLDCSGFTHLGFQFGTHDLESPVFKPKPHFALLAAKQKGVMHSVNVLEPHVAHKGLSYELIDGNHNGKTVQGDLIYKSDTPSLFDFDIREKTPKSSPLKQIIKKKREVGVDSRMQKPRRIRKRRFDGCNCKSSNCLRLHCACFKELGYCKPTCRCANCLNRNEFTQARNFTIEKTKLILSSAFVNNEPKEVVDINGNPQKVNPKGCSCTTGCSKNYCNCRRIGGKCSHICKCEECFNDKVDLSREAIHKVYERKSRKKHKIVIYYDEKRMSASKSIIEFKVYQKQEEISK